MRTLNEIVDNHREAMGRGQHLVLVIDPTGTALADYLIDATNGDWLREDHGTILLREMVGKVDRHRQGRP